MSTQKMRDTYQLNCDCGHVRMTVRGAPELSLYCHCGSCRDMYSVDVLSATGWSDDHLDGPDESTMLVHKMDGKQMRRYSCPKCGTIMYGRHRPGIPVIPHGVFRKANGGRLPAALAPTLHLFYSDRVIDVDDDLEKCADGSAIGL